MTASSTLRSFFQGVMPFIRCDRNNVPFPPGAWADRKELMNMLKHADRTKNARRGP